MKKTEGLLDFLKNCSTFYHNKTKESILTEKTLNDFIKSLQVNDYRNQHLVDYARVDHIVQNGCEEKMRKLFGPNIKAMPQTPEIFRLDGYDVHYGSFVPWGEMWMCNKFGDVLKRVKLL